MQIVLRHQNWAQLAYMQTENNADSVCMTLARFLLHNGTDSDDLPHIGEARIHLIIKARLYEP